MIKSTSLAAELTPAEAKTLFDFAVLNLENMKLSKIIQIPVLNCLLEHQTDILKHNKVNLGSKSLTELFATISLYLSENYAKKAEAPNETKELLSRLVLSIFADDLLEIGLARLSFDESDDSFIPLFEYLVTISNALPDEKADLGHLKLVQFAKLFLVNLATGPAERMKEKCRDKKVLTILSYVSHLALHLDVQKRQPSADLIATNAAHAPSTGTVALNDRLCTYTTTQREFQNQHWYHCYTCEMFDSVGVCSVCANVCHQGHQLGYVKYSSFFCDCGAQEQGTCQGPVQKLKGD